MNGDNMLRITPDMDEEEVLSACAEAVIEASPDDVIAQLEQTAAERGCSSALSLVKAAMKEERAQYDTIEGWLATLPGRVS